MFLSQFVKDFPRKNFIYKVKNPDVSINKICEKIANISHGSIIIQYKKNLRLFSDGDLVRYYSKAIDQKINFLRMKKYFKKIDYRETLYSAFKIIQKNKINFLPIEKNKEIISFITREDVNNLLSPERLYVEKKKIDKFNLDLSKHLTRYNFALMFVGKNFTVLDAACGTGYGSYILSKKSRKVISVVSSKHAIFSCKKNFKSKNINFIKKNILDLKYKNKFDLIVSLETIEHVKKKDAIEWIKKCSYMLKKNGVLVCSSPLLRIRNNKPFITNPHHLHEMKKNEFFKIISKYFKKETICSFIQKDNQLIPIFKENEGLSIIVVRK